MDDVADRSRGELAAAAAAAFGAAREHAGTDASLPGRPATRPRLGGLFERGAARRRPLPGPRPADAAPPARRPRPAPTPRSTR